VTSALPEIGHWPLDPRAFDPGVVDPETTALNASVEQSMTRAPARWEMPAHIERQLPPAAGAVPVNPTSRRVRERTVPGPAGQIPVRIIEPDCPPTGVYLHFHPGGFCVGAARNHDAMLAETVERAGVVTVSVDYRLGPEDPHPAGPADCEAAAMWVIDHAPTEYGTSALVLGGESAGSTLAAVTALRLRDRHGYTGLSGLNLSQGAYDLRLTPTLRAYGQRRLILNTPTAQSLLDRYAQAANREDPDVSPLFADLTGMPRALFTVGTLDPLLDDTGFMYFRWIAARNHAELDVYPGAMHGFNLFPTALGRQACARIDRFIGGCVREESSGG